MDENPGGVCVATRRTLPLLAPYFLFFPVERQFFRKKPEKRLKRPLVLFVGALFLGRATSDEKILEILFCVRTYDAENILGRAVFSSAKRIRSDMPAKPKKTISACV